MRAFIFTLALLASTVVFGQRDVRALKYGKEKQQYLDLFLPKTVTRDTPVLVLLHGGAWSMGGNEYTDKHARDLRDRGIIVANVDYRYVSNTISGKNLIDDIDSAITFLKFVSKEYGFGKTKIHIGGISAGAHLALLYGYTHPGILSISALCAPSRMDGAEAIAFIKKNGHLDIIEKVAGAKFNETGPNPAFESISPYNRITDVPTLLIHGDADPLVPVELSRAFFARLQELKVDAKLEIRKGSAHDAGMNNADYEAQNLSAIIDWIRTHNH